MDVNDLPPLWLAYISDPSDSGQCAIIIGAKPPYFEVCLSVCLSVYVGLTIIKVNKLLTLIVGFAPSMFYILLVNVNIVFVFQARYTVQ